MATEPARRLIAAVREMWGLMVMDPNRLSEHTRQSLAALSLSANGWQGRWKTSNRGNRN